MPSNPWSWNEQRQTAVSQADARKGLADVFWVSTDRAETADVLAGRLLSIAARLSLGSPFGWASPDCEALTKAAYLLSPRLKPELPEGVATLSAEGEPAPVQRSGE